MSSLMTTSRPETQNNQDILEVMPMLIVDVHDKQAVASDSTPQEKSTPAGSVNRHNILV
jgi:hypothetical protein